MLIPLVCPDMEPEPLGGLLTVPQATNAHWIVRAVGQRPGIGVDLAGNAPASPRGAARGGSGVMRAAAEDTTIPPLRLRFHCTGAMGSLSVPVDNRQADRWSVLNFCPYGSGQINLPGRLCPWATARICPKGWSHT